MGDKEAQLRLLELEQQLEALQAVQDLRQVLEAYRAVESLLLNQAASPSSMDHGQLGKLMASIGMRFETELARAETSARACVDAYRLRA